MDSQSLLLALGAAASVVLLVIGASRVLLAQETQVRARLGQLRAASMAEPLAQAAPDVLRRRSFIASGLLARAVQRFAGGGARQQLDRAGIAMSVGDFLVLRVALVAGGVVAAVVAGGLAGLSEMQGSLAAAGAALGALLPVVALRWLTRRRAHRVERQLVELCEVMSAMLSSGFGYMQALRVTAQQVGRPLGAEIERFLDAVNLGSDFDQALAETGDRLNSPDFEVVATALSVQRRTGGNLSEILHGVGVTIRERQTFQREIRALTSRERFSAIVVALFPLLLVTGLWFLMPDVFGRLLTDPIGRIILGVAIALDIVGYAAARRLANLEM